MMFLAHFSNTPLPIILEWTSKEIDFWYNEAMKLYKEMNDVNE
jgi:hypothetical protein